MAQSTTRNYNRNQRNANVGRRPLNRIQNQIRDLQLSLNQNKPISQPQMSLSAGQSRLNNRTRKQIRRFRSQRRPKITQNTNGTVVLKHSGVFTNLQVGINKVRFTPGETGYEWLDYFSRAFRQYHLNSASYVFAPALGAMRDGTITVGIDYTNSKDITELKTVRSLANNKTGVIGRMFTGVIDAKQAQDKEWLDVKHESDNEEQNCFNIYAYVDGTESDQLVAGQTVGTFTLHFNITFSSPVITSAQAATPPGVGIVTDSAPIATIPINKMPPVVDADEKDVLEVINASAINTDGPITTITVPASHAHQGDELTVAMTDIQQETLRFYKSVHGGSFGNKVYTHPTVRIRDTKGNVLPSDVVGPVSTPNMKGGNTVRAFPLYEHGIRTQTLHTDILDSPLDFDILGSIFKFFKEPSLETGVDIAVDILGGFLVNSTNNISGSTSTNAAVETSDVTTIQAVAVGDVIDLIVPALPAANAWDLSQFGAAFIVNGAGVIRDDPQISGWKSIMFNGDYDITWTIGATEITFKPKEYITPFHESDSLSITMSYLAVYYADSTSKVKNSIRAPDNEQVVGMTLMMKSQQMNTTQTNQTVGGRGAYLNSAANVFSISSAGMANNTIGINDLARGQVLPEGASDWILTVNIARTAIPSLPLAELPTLKHPNPVSRLTNRVY